MAQGEKSVPESCKLILQTVEGLRKQETRHWARIKVHSYIDTDRVGLILCLSEVSTLRKRREKRPEMRHENSPLGAIPNTKTFEDVQDQIQLPLRSIKIPINCKVHCIRPLALDGFLFTRPNAVSHSMS